MMLLFYYRIADARLVNAKAADGMKALQVEDEGKKFAALFGAKAIFYNGFTPRFAGIAFDKESPPPQNGWKVWTAPQPGRPCMLPLQMSAVPRKLASLANHMNVKYKEFWPTAAAEKWTSNLLNALGISDAAAQGNAMNIFYDEDGVTWVATTVPLDGLSVPHADGSKVFLENFSEIFGSEFDAARNKFQQREAEKLIAQQKAAAAVAEGIATGLAANEP